MILFYVFIFAIVIAILCMCVIGVIIALPTILSALGETRDILDEWKQEKRAE